METVNYLRAIRRSWYLLVIGLVLGGACGWLVFHQTPASYRATTQYVVGYAGSSDDDETAARELAVLRAQAFVEVANTQPVVSAAVREAGRDGVTPVVTANTSSEQSSLFWISVTSTDRRAVAPIANAYQKVLIPELTRLVGSLGISVRLNVVRPAATPRAPYSPVLTHDVDLGLAGGLLVGLLAALLVEALDRGLRTSEDVARVLGLPIMGSIPRDRSKVPLPALTQPRGARAEAYRQVRTAWFALDPPAQVLGITSSGQAEGKTTLATNVAAVASRAGHSVIVVDTDLRRPRVAEVFEGTADQPGLAEVLSGAVTLKAAIQETGEAMPDILAAGEPPTDPSEVLASAAFDKLITDLRGRYDYVVIDTAPVLPVTDALVVAPRVDAIIVVARIGSTTHDRLERMMGSLARVHAHVVGVVPNGTRGAGVGGYRGSYYYGAKPAKSRRAHTTKTSAGISR